jgi:glycosyltransferase involved in cell wall biosynthesis
MALAVEFVAVSDLAAAPFPPTLRPHIRRIPNGFDPDRLTTTRRRTEIRRGWGLPERTIAVGYCGRFSPEKNPLAAARLAAHWPEAAAVYQCPALSRATAVRGVSRLLNDRAVFPEGPVAEFYQGIDVMVMASREEGFGLALVEAWAAGVPVIATSTGVLPEAEARFGPLAAPIPQQASRGRLLAAARTAIAPEFRETVRRARQVARTHYTARQMGRTIVRLGPNQIPQQNLVDG